MFVCTATVDSSPLCEKVAYTCCTWLNGVLCGFYRLSAVSATNWFILWMVHERSLAILDTHRRLGIGDGGVIGTLIGALQGHSEVPDLNALTSAAPSLECIFNPANVSPFVSSPILNVNQEYHAISHALPTVHSGRRNSRPG